MYRAEIIQKLAQMLSGYDDVTWNKLKPGRRKTYERAAATLWLTWEEFADFRLLHHGEPGA